MQVRGPLMIEHRLIEKMVPLIDQKLEQMQRDNTIDPVFVDTIVDFVRTYTDRTHHGKEEEILFRDLNRKNLSIADRKVMDELIREHVHGREVVGRLVKAKAEFLAGDKTALKTIADQLYELVQFYPKHIEKEDRVFFPAAMKYLSESEQEAMLKEYWEFDRKMIHEKYEKVIAQLIG